MRVLNKQCQWLSLGNLCSVDSGYAFQSKEYKARGIPIVRISNVKHNGLNWGNTVFWSENVPEFLKRYLLKPDDILISMTGDVGITVQVKDFDIPALLNQRVGRIRRINDDIDSRYLFYATQTKSFLQAVRNSAFGALQLNVSTDSIEKVCIPLPPLPEQRTISHILQTVQRAIQTRRKELEFERERKAALMEYLFSYGTSNRRLVTKETKFGRVPDHWQLQRLDDCAIVQTGITKGRKLEDKKTVSLPYLRVANVQDGYLDLSEIKTIEILPSETEKYKLHPGDVVVTEGGDFDKLGRGFLWEGQIIDCVHQNHIFAIRTNRKLLLPEYLTYLIQSEYGKAYFLSVAHKTTNLACINSTKLKAFPTLLPSLDEQKDIADIFRSCDAKIAALEKENSLHEELFRALLEELMNGRISTLPLIEQLEKGTLTHGQRTPDGTGTTH